MGFRKDSICIDENGYKCFKDLNKLVHLYVAEKMLGRKLQPCEAVHHKNRNKLDNRRSNLWVFESQQQHYNIHKRDHQKYGC